MHTKKDLSFSSLRKMLSERFSNFNDQRQNKKIDHSMHDVFMSGFAMMFFQDPSMLQFQKSLDDKLHTNNLKTLFQVTSIPKDSRMRDVIDEIDSKELEPLFNDFFRPLQRGKHLEQYRVLDKYYIVSLDGSGYFSSDTICCPGCLTREYKKNTVRYEHQIVQAALMHPDMRQVIPLCPEEVRNTDGAEKQDCEISAGKRLLKKIRASHPKLPLIIVADSLYSKQPVIEEIISLNMHYVLAAKPGDHKKLMEWVNEQKILKEVSRMEEKDKKGRIHIYGWINGIPLNDNKNAPMVNYFEYFIEDKGKITYHNSWVTDLSLDNKIIIDMVRTGRCRWKIENEVFNTLKNQGYSIEHNYGHGKKHLSFNFFLLNLLAFFMHQIFELTDLSYRAVRNKCGSKMAMWERLRSVLCFIIFDTWDTLMQRMLDPSRYA